MKILILADTTSLKILPGTKDSFIAGCLNMFSKYVGKNDILVQCPENIRQKIGKSLAGYNVYFEPKKQGTSAAIGLGIARIFAQNPTEKVLVAYSDHPVSYENNLFRALDVVQKFNDNLHKLILIGVNPTMPATHYGYIKIGKVIAEIGATVAFEMAEFHEKPNTLGANKFCKSWQYLWNTGYLFGTAEQIMDLYKHNLPNDYRGLMAIKESLNSPIENQVVKTIYPTLTKQSIDKAIYEKIHQNGIAVVAVDLNISAFG